MALDFHSVVQGDLVVGLCILSLETARCNCLQNIQFSAERFYSGEMLLEGPQRETTGKMKSTECVQPD